MKAERRKEQNRASQRRFRAKKENEIRGAADQVASLESFIQNLQIHNMELEQTNLALKGRLAELEGQLSYPDSAIGSTGGIAATSCTRCGKALTDDTVDMIDFFWPVEDGEFQQSARLETSLAVFDNELLPYDT